MRLLGGPLHVAPAAKKYPLCPGTFYFEFTDEWYKQASAPLCTDALCNWVGTTAENTNFPGGWWDEAGFGVFSTRRAAGVNNCAPTIVYLPQFNYFGPDQAYDIIELGKSAPNTRTPLFNAIREVYGTVPVAKNGGALEHEEDGHGHSERIGNIQGQNSETGSLILSPNPAEESISFNKPVSGSIMNMEGKTMLLINEATQVSISNFAKGIYIVVSSTGERIKFIKK